MVKGLWGRGDTSALLEAVFLEFFSVIATIIIRPLLRGFSVC